jgi:hypothetical protein
VNAHFCFVDVVVGVVVVVLKASVMTMVGRAERWQGIFGWLAAGGRSVAEGRGSACAEGSKNPGFP